VSESIQQKVDRLELPFDSAGLDPYGISKKHLAFAFKAFEPLYRYYFQVKSHGLENVPQRGRAMLIGNHSGGIAVDGGLVIASMFFELDPPRLVQSMVEKFLNTVPFASVWASRCGQFPGLPEHAVRLLEDDRLLLVFPEGARGTAKLYKERYSLVDFGTGFMRLALQTKTPIIPFGCVGGGDAMPTIANLYKLGQLFGMPYIPVTRYLLPVPRPARFDLCYGAPLRFEGTGSEDDQVIEGYVGQVKQAIAGLIDEGRRHRGELGEAA
jgi:1-acyl-sn-glycerol-3-phosphate acyltransferase